MYAIAGSAQFSCWTAEEARENTRTCVIANHKCAQPCLALAVANGSECSKNRMFVAHDRQH